MIYQDQLIRSIIVAANQMGALVSPVVPGPGTKTTLTITFPDRSISSIVINQMYNPPGDGTLYIRPS